MNTAKVERKSPNAGKLEDLLQKLTKDTSSLTEHIEHLAIRLAPLMAENQEIAGSPVSGVNSDDATTIIRLTEIDNTVNLVTARLEDILERLVV